MILKNNISHILERSDDMTHPGAIPVLCMTSPLAPPTGLALPLSPARCHSTLPKPLVGFEGNSYNDLEVLEYLRARNIEPAITRSDDMEDDADGTILREDDVVLGDGHTYVRRIIHLTGDIERWTVAKVSRLLMPAGWRKEFMAVASEMSIISRYVEDIERESGKFYPLRVDLFRAFYVTPLREVKVVVVGQDPYPQSLRQGKTTVPMTMGLSFSVRRGSPITPSLTTVFKELENTVANFRKPSHGDLTCWATQGVLLLNTVLTVTPNTPESYDEKRWAPFVSKVVKAIVDRSVPVVFMLWGRKARNSPVNDIIKGMGGKILVLTAGHPSPRNTTVPFLGCDHFVKANEHLTKYGMSPINWSVH